MTTEKMNSVVERQSRIADFSAVDEKRYLDESTFKHRWMPLFLRFFAGLEEGDVTYWVEQVSGNWYQEVHIVEDLNRPEETFLFTVPAFMSRQRDVIPPDLNISELLAVAKVQSEHYPGAGEQLIMDEVFSRIPKPTLDIAEVEQWKKIYAYYELEAPFNQNDKAEISSKPVVNEEVIGFDDDI